jgi:hypothetical protein
MAPYMNLPLKYEDPDYTVSTSIASQYGEDVWRVYTDRDSVLVYSDRNLTRIVDTIGFLEPFVVWDESESALRIVAKADSGALLSGRVFGDGAIEKGWVEKRNMILWPRPIKKEGLLMKAMVLKSKHPHLNNPLLPSHYIEVPEGQFRIYNILKIEGPNLLLLNTDLLHDQLKREDAFWIDNRDVELIESRHAYIPDWNRVLDGVSIPVYTSKTASFDQSTEVLSSIEEMNTYRGFFTKDDSNVMGISVMTPHNNRLSQAYLNNVFQDFKKVILVDYRQYLDYRELISIFSSYEHYNPSDLEFKLLDFFLKKGVNIEEVEFMTVGEMLELVTGIKLQVDRGDELIQVQHMSITYRNYLMNQFSAFERINSDITELDKYRFISDMYYYWLPLSWIVPEELYSLTLMEQQVPVPPARDYHTYALHYLDGSSILNLQPAVFDEIYERLSANLKSSVSRVETDSLYGLYVYMSNGINTLKNDHSKHIESTVDEILIDIRNGTFFSDRKQDKLILETELLLNRIETIYHSLEVNYYVSERFLRDDLQERCYMIRDLPERLYSIAMPKNGTSVTINIHVYSILYEKQLQETIQFMQDIYFNEDTNNFKLNIVKYN